MIKKISLWIIIIILIISAFIIFMLTPLGLRVTMDIASNFLPGELKYQKISGIILGPIELKKVTYTDENTVITAKKIEWNWQLFALLHKEIHMTDLKANDVNIKSLGQKQSLNLEKLHQQWKSIINNPELHHAISTKAILLQKKAEEFELPIALKIDKAKIKRVKFINANNETIIYLDFLNLKGTIKKNKLNIELAMEMEKPYPSKTSLNIKGDFSNYNINAASKNKYFNWQLYGNGNWQHINLTIQPSHTLEGTLHGNLSIRWSPEINWHINLVVNNLNAKLLNSQWPEKLNLQLQTKGSLIYGEPRFSLKGNFTTSNIQLFVDGNYKRTLSFNWKMNINQIAKVFSNYNGSLKSAGNLYGTLNALKTTGTLSAKSFSAVGYQADTLQSNWSIDLSQQTKSKIAINATNIQGPQLSNSQLQLEANGKLKQHDISGKLSSEHGTLMINAKGGLENKIWSGTIHQFSITSKNLPAWQLSSPAKLTASTTNINLSKACLRSPHQGYICLQGNWSNNQAWQFSMTGKNLDLHLLSGFLYDNFRLKGKLNLAASLNGTGKKIQSAKWNIHAGPGKFSYLYNKKWLENDYQTISITGNYNDNQANAQLDLKFTNKNYFQANLTLPNLNFSKFSMQNQKIEGNITGQLNDLKMITAAFPNILIPSGFLSANLNIAGTLDSPLLNGQIKLAQGKIDLPDLDLQITNINFNINANRNVLIYKGSAQSGNNPIKLEGKTNLSPKFKTTLSIKGNNILVMNTTEYIVYASPDLNIVLDGDKIHVKGNIEIPKAILSPADFTSVVTLPKDEIEFVSDAKVKKPSPWKIFLNVEVRLGDNISVNAFGATGKLAGKVKIESTPKTAILGKGKIFVRDGKFNNYGIKLTIDPQSNFEFSNTPILNPNLNLRAYKTANVVSSTVVSQLQQTKYIVGIRVRGDIKNPLISFYSIPANLSQVNILSLLAVGTVTSTKSSSTALLFGALGALQGSGHQGLGKAGSFIKGIQQGLGLSEFGVETQATQDVIGTTLARQTSFVIGKQLTDRLYLRYSHGLTSTGFLNVNQFTVRYLLSRNWAIQSYSNTLGSGADILYTIQVK